MGTENRQLTPSWSLGQARFVVALTHVQSSPVNISSLEQLSTSNALKYNNLILRSNLLNTG